MNPDTASCIRITAVAGKELSAAAHVVTVSVVPTESGLFFFFKQKTAYEVSLGLVGSEMCIRDSSRP